MTKKKSDLRCFFQGAIGDLWKWLFLIYVTENSLCPSSILNSPFKLGHIFSVYTNCVLDL